MRRDAVIKSHNSQGKLQRVCTDILVWIQVMAQCTSVLVRESVLSQFSFELRHDKITFVSDFPRAAASAADTKINKPREGRERKTESALHFRPGHLFGAEGLTVCPYVRLSLCLSACLSDCSSSRAASCLHAKQIRTSCTTMADMSR